MRNLLKSQFTAGTMPSTVMLIREKITSRHQNILEKKSPVMPKT